MIIFVIFGVCVAAAFLFGVLAGMFIALLPPKDDGRIV